MRAYIDTSVLVAAHTREPRTALAQAWLTAQGGNQLILSSWTLVECDSALAIKERRGEIDAATQAAVIAEIEALAARIKPLIAPTDVDYRRARELCRYSASRLRAGDALHLALALRLGATHLATLDEILAANAIAHGLASPIDF